MIDQALHAESKQSTCNLAEDVGGCNMFIQQCSACIDTKFPASYPPTNTRETIPRVLLNTSASPGGGEGSLGHWAQDAWTLPRLRVCGGVQVFGGYRNLAPIEECGRGPCSRGRHSLLMQHSTQHSAARQSQQRRTTEQSRTTHTIAAQDSATPRHTKLAEYTPEEHARTRATQHSTQRSRAKRQHRTHHTIQPRPHEHTQHRRGASLMHSWEPTPSRPHREVEAAQT